MPDAAAVPQSIADNPSLKTWFEIGPPNTITLFTGKVELGQGILRALRQIVAEELGLTIDQVETVSGDTTTCPYEWFTAGSMSIEVAGSAARLAAANLRRHLFAAAAQRLGLAAEELTTDRGQLFVGRQATAETFWTLAPMVNLDVAIDPHITIKPPADYVTIGEDVPRDDLIAKVSGSPYIHDFCLPGLLHGRVLRKPARAAQLLSFDATKTEAMPGVHAVVRDGQFLGVLCETEYQAVLALQRMERDAKWSDPYAGADPTVHAADFLDRLPAEERVLQQSCAAAELEGDDVLRAEFTRPLLAHGSIGPSCAVAAWDDTGIRLWTHSQGVFALREQAARVTGIATERIQVQHMPGAGCYGHNGADDAALDALFLARHANGRPVRTLWRRIDELRHEPLGSPMKVRVAAKLNEDGRIAAWSLDTWSGAFAQRPGWNGGVNLHAAADREPTWPFAPAQDLPLHNGGSKNALAGYNFAQNVTHHFVREMPFRLSALRSLGAFANVFAIEGFMDELAAAAGCDPLAFRLKHLSDPRARAVLEEAAALAGWHHAPAEGRHLGIGYARFKGKGAYCAVVAEVETLEDIRLARVWCAVDAGLAIVPDDLAAQIEGGIIMAASWTLIEAMPTEGARITAETWLDYPILPFDQVPEITVKLLSDPAHESVGAGEVVLGPCAGAIANAVSAALGMRMRDLPLTRDRIMQALLEA